MIFLKLFCLIFRISPWFLEVTEVDSLILILPVKGKILEYLVFIGKTRKAYIYWLGTMYKWAVDWSNLKFLGCICTYLCIKRAWWSWQFLECMALLLKKSSIYRKIPKFKRVKYVDSLYRKIYMIIILETFNVSFIVRNLAGKLKLVYNIYKAVFTWRI